MVKNMTTVESFVNQVNRSKLKNNTQKVLLTLLQAKGEWVARTALKIPSAPSRIRDLRTEEFGKFKIECASASDLGRQIKSTKTKNPTYYRLITNSVTLNKISKVFKKDVKETHATK